MIRLALAVALIIPAQASLTGIVESTDGQKLQGTIQLTKEEVIVTTTGGSTTSLPINQLSTATFEKENSAEKSTPTPPRNGLRGRYYSNIKHEDDPVERIDAAISFDWGETAPIKGVRPNGFSIRWEGEVSCPVSGEITFEVESDDGCRLWVDDEKLIDHWEAQPPTARRANIRLEANKRYPIVLEYYDAWNNAIARLRWTAENLPLQIIPTKNLFPLPTNNPIPEEFHHAVHLRSASFIRGRVTSSTRYRVQLLTPHGLASIPIPAVRHIIFSENWGTDLAGILKHKPPGVAYLNRDFAEARFQGLESGVATFESILFGKLEVPLSELRAIKLAEHHASPANFWLLTRSDSRIFAKSIQTQPDNQLKIRDASGYHLTIPAAEIRQIRASINKTKK